MLAGTTEAQSSLNGNDSAQIIAEGVGIDADEALKDAFRNAVRQEVGALVDAETLIKNDELIEDKVLTYSGGFIKSYEEIAGSKKIQGGLHRIRIQAQVERRGVVAKLKESKVSVKEIDGKGMFAEIVTEKEAQTNSTALVKKALSELPKLWVAELIGKPEFDKATSEVVVSVGIKIDLEKYKSFFEQTTETLDKVALQKSSFTSKGRKQGGKMDRNDPIERFVLSTKDFLDKPLSKEESVTHWKLLLCHPPRSDLSTLKWTLYVLDASASEILSDLELPFDQRPINNHPPRLIVELCDTHQMPVAEDEIIIKIGHYHHERSSPGLLTCLEWNQSQGRDLFHLFNFENDLSTHTALRDMNEYLRERSYYRHLSTMGQPYFRGYVGPLVFSDRGTIPYVGYRPVLNIERRIKVSLDELKSVQSVRCKVVRDEN